jgi:hypothetical protein
MLQRLCTKNREAIRQGCIGFTYAPRMQRLYICTKDAEALFMQQGCRGYAPMLQRIHQTVSEAPMHFSYALFQ